MHRHGEDRARCVVRDAGFTLVELLVVVVILGILVAIAIPVYLNHREGANDKAALSDARAIVNALEQCYADASLYPTAATVTVGDSPGLGGNVCAGRAASVSPNTTIAYFTISGSNRTGYIVGSSAGDTGSGATYCFNSVQAGQIKSTTAVTRYRTAC